MNVCETCRVCGRPLSARDRFTYGDRCEDDWVNALVALSIKGQPPPHTKKRVYTVQDEQEAPRDVITRHRRTHQENSSGALL
jgi:hypothetical protein